MPVVPTLDAPTLAAPIDAPARYQSVTATPDAFGASIGLATQALGAGFAELARTTQMARASQVQTAAEGGRLGLMKQVGELRVALEQEPDPSRILSRWKEGVTEIQKGLNDQYGDRSVANLIGRDLAVMAARAHPEVMRLSVERTQQASMAQLDSTLATFASQAASANPEARGGFMAAGEDAITQRVLAGHLRADKAEEMRQRFVGRVDQAQVLQLINQNPSAALATLANPASFPQMDPVQRERLFSSATSALNTRVSMAERGERRAEAALRRQGDAAANDMYAKIALAEAGQGEMPSVQDVMKWRDALSPGETSALLSKIRSAGAATDKPEAVATLMPLVDQADPETFNAMATRMLKEGSLKPDTYRTMVSQNRNARRDDGPASAYRSGRGFVSDALDPGNVVGGTFMRGPLAAARQNALADFDTWARANPTATPEESVTRARDLVGRYQATADSESKLALPRPYGFDGARDTVTEQAVRAAAQRLVTLRREGRLSAEELQRETAVLEAWSSLLAREMAKAPAKPTTTTPGRGGGPNVQR